MVKNIVIVSLEHNDNYVSIENGYKTKKYCKMCLGHEIHMTRFVLIDMLLQNHISKEDIVVTLKDRKFLYENFIRCMDVEEYQSMDKTGYNIINLSLITGSYIPVNKESILSHFQYNTMDVFYTEDFKSLLNQIQYCSLDYDEKYDKDYVVIHHRYQSDIESLKRLINKINSTMNVNVVIFNNNIGYLQEHLKFENLLLVDNLQVYASYLNAYQLKHKCLLFISEWSGGGQLSHYCCHGKIIYYFNTYKDFHYIGQEKTFAKKSMETDMFQYWDFKNSRDNIDINIFYSINDIINQISSFK